MVCWFETPRNGLSTQSGQECGGHRGGGRPHQKVTRGSTPDRKMYWMVLISKKNRNCTI